MTPSDRSLRNRSYIVQCSAEAFDHAAWLSAVHSQVLSVDEDNHSLLIFPMTELLRGQFDRLGAFVISASAN